MPKGKQKGTTAQQPWKVLEVAGRDKLKELRRFTTAPGAWRIKKDNFHNAMIVSVHVGTGKEKKKNTRRRCKCDGFVVDTQHT